MANLSRNFIAGRMNKSVDERLVPNGEYIDALNIRMGSTENSEIGVIENAKGNLPLTTLIYNGIPLSSDARCIGAFEDGTNETIYWFVHDNNYPSSPTGKIDLVLSYDIKTTILTYHLISIRDGATSNTTLNFDPTYVITGVDKVQDLLYWTDDYNAPRQINVTKGYANPSAGVDQFSAESILVIKKPPVAAPVVVPTITSTQDNFLEERFICFAYRYRYDDGEYSATSQWSKPAFLPNTFNYDFATALNSGMQSIANMAEVTYNSGGPLVKAIDLLFKEMDFPTIRIIEKINKKNEGLGDNTDYTFQFQNSKIFTILADSEILRLYDNVPRFAKAQTMMGNRLMYGNYVEGYDMVDSSGSPTSLEYIAKLDTNEVGSTELDYNLDTGTYSWDSLQTIGSSVIYLDFANLDLVSGALLTIEIQYSNSLYSGDPPLPTETQGNTLISFPYVLQKSFNSVYELAIDPDFVEKIGTVSTIQTVQNSCDGLTLTDRFNCSIEQTLVDPGNVTFTKYESGISAAGQAIQIFSSPASTKIGLQLPAIRYVDNPITRSVYSYYEITFAAALYSEVGSPTSLHSNRGYEVGIVYMDEFNRSSTALVSPNNAVHVPCSASEFQNKINITIPTGQIAPYWAERYKFVIKPDRDTYETIYSQFFFRDPTSGADYFLLEGQNSQKIQLGDELIVKKDTVGPLNTCTYTTVLEKEAQQADFLSPKPVDGSGVELAVPAGVYMKLRANNFSTTIESPDGLPTVLDSGELRSSTADTRIPCAPIQIPVSVQDPNNPTMYIDLPIPSGSKITLEFESDREGRGCTFNLEGRTYIYKNDFTSSKDYNSFKEWWDGDNVAGTLNADFVVREATCSAPEPVATYWPILATSTANIVYECSGEVNFQFSKFNPVVNNTFLRFEGIQGYGGKKTRTNNKARITVVRANSTVVFETDPLDAAPNLWYESSEVYNINNAGEHLGNEGDQSQVFASNTPAIINTDFYNCYSFGNGVESYKIQDSITGKRLSLGNRAYITTTIEYKESRRFSDITYSGIYNEESNINKLNEFNLGLLNYKACEQSFGPINKLFGRETDVLTLQEDKISYVVQGKNILTDAGGGSALMASPEILANQVARIEEYGISSNPESFVQWGPDKYFTDAKRGAVIKLTGTERDNDQLSVISQNGMRTWFRDLFNESFTTQKLGGFDPYMNEYVLASNEVLLPQDIECDSCNTTISLNVSSESSFESCFNLGDLVGDVNIDYIVSDVSGTFNITAVYNGITYTTGNVTASGTLTFPKSVVNVSTVDLTITSTGLVTLGLIINCPDADSVTIFLITVTSSNEVGLFTTNQYRWSDGTFNSPLHSQNIQFAQFYTNPIVSQYQTITGLQGGGVIPANGATVTMFNNTIVPDNFVFNQFEDNFKYLRTNTLYENNAADIQSLLAATTEATPINPPINGNTAYYSQFTMPSTGSYLYLVWDYRNSTAIQLCYDADSRTTACCDCQGEGNPATFVIQDCITGDSFFALQTPFLFNIGDVVKYKEGAGGGFGADRCGTIVSNAIIPPTATIQVPNTFECGDVINCPSF